MAVDLTSTVGLFSILDGTVQDEAPNLLVTRGPLDAQGREAGQLAIAVELVGRSLGEEEMYEELLQAISDAYFRHPGNITARLQEAIQEANALLVHANAALLPEERLLGGVTCVFHMGQDVYIGQAGPAVVFLGQKGALRRFPESSPWLQKPLPSAPERLYPAPLGVHATVHANLFHATVQPGDVLVLGTTALAHTVATKAVEEAVLFQPIEDALYNLARLCGDAEVACMVILVHAKGERPAVAAPAPAAPAAPAEEPAEPEAPPEAEPAALPEEAAPEAELAEEDLLPADRETAAEALAPGRPAPAAPDLEELPLPEEAAEAEEAELPAAPVRAPSRPARGGFSLLGLGRALRRGLRAFFSDVALGSAVVAGWLASLFRRKPRPVAARPRPAPAARAARPAVRRLWLLLAIAIPLVIILILVTQLIQSKQRLQRYDELLRLAESKAALAQSAPTAQEKQTLLNESLVLLGQARAIGPHDPRAAQVAAQVQATLDQVEGTVRLDPPLVLYQPPASEQAALDGLVIAGSDLYLLDAKNARLIRKTLDETGVGLQPDQGAPTIVARGATVGGYAVANLWKMAWAAAMDNRASSGLLVATADRRLLEYSPRRGLSLLALAGTDKWQQPAAMASYRGNLYVLDAGANQIYRYSPTAGGYEAAPDDWFALSQARDLRGAVDMAIDGAIYILYGAGRLEKFMRGDKQPFSLEGLAQPLQQPVALYTDVDDEAKHVYVADPGAQRVVQFAKDGRFVRQFRFREGDFFARITDLRVDEASARLYFTAGDALYVCALPRP